MLKTAGRLGLPEGERERSEPVGGVCLILLSEVSVTEFDTFWASFPRKTAKLDAMRAYEKARRLDSAENILAGLERYKRNKPDYADWCHPATFLNKGRWMDEEDAPPERVVREYWADECTREHGGACINQFSHGTRMRHERQDREAS